MNLTKWIGRCMFILYGCMINRKDAGRTDMLEDAVTLCEKLDRNLEIFRYRLGAPDNADVLVRRFRSGAFESALIAMDIR